MVWNKINEMLEKIKFENNIRLQHLVFGCNFFLHRILSLKLFLTILEFTIFKSCFYPNKRQRKLMFIGYLKTNSKEK